MGLVIVNAINNALSVTAILSGFVQLCEDVPKLSCIGLFQKGVDLIDQVSDGCFLVHTLIRQWTEFGPESCYHPAGQINVAPIGRLFVTLHAHHDLLSDEPMPAT